MSIAEKYAGLLYGSRDADVDIIQSAIDEALGTAAKKCDACGVGMDNAHNRSIGAATWCREACEECAEQVRALKGGKI